MIEFKTMLIILDNPKERILIDIPFNLWNEFGKKGMLEVDLNINNVLIPNIGLLPRGNGNYSIRFTKQIQKKIKAMPLDELHISITLSEKKTEVKIQESKEYRRICNVSLVKQTNANNCGQACVSMLTGIDIDEVCKDMHSSRVW